MFALADCNNFYASCERVFNPKLINKPIVVLSNNDGCIIARSQEAIDLKIPMGAPLFQIRNLINLHDVKVFSANFTLYGDMSRRVMQILNSYVPNIEIYSIDEAFLSLDSANIQMNYLNYALDIRRDVLKSTGLPISIGLAPTKVLAKICNHVAKKQRGSGVFSWGEVRDKNLFLNNLNVGEIWGIGYRTTQKLNELGIYTALQLRDVDERWLRKNFSVTELRVATELKEISCLKLEEGTPPRKNIMSSRSFGKPVESLKELEEAVSTYITRASEKLRQQGSVASFVYVSIKTNKHRIDFPQYFKYIIMGLETPTSYNPHLIKAALNGLKVIYKDGYRYKKATVMLLGILPKSQVPLNLYQSTESFDINQKLMSGLDKLNNRYGREVLKYASNGIKQEWKLKKELCSPQYTTKWEEILKVY